MSNSPAASEIAIQTTVDAPSVSTAGMTTRVLRGSLWTLGGQGVVMLALFLSTPFLIRILGSESYGVLALVNVLVSYLLFADMGMGSASTKFGADAHAREDDSGEAAVVWTSLLIALVPATLAALTFIFLARPIVVEVLRIPIHLHNEAILALRVAIVAFVARTAASVLNTPQLIRLRMDLSAFINAGTLVVQYIFIPVALMMGGNLVTVVTIIAGFALAAALLHLVVSGHLQPLLFQPRVDSALIKPLARFGGGLVVSTLAAMVLLTAEKVLLARFASVVALAHYSVAFSVASLLAIVPAAISQSLLPAFSRMQSSQERERLQQLYTRALRGNLLWIAPAALLLCAVAKPLFTLWAGPEYSQQSTLPFYILVGGIFFNVMAIVPYTLLIASGRSDLLARIHLLELLPYIVCASLFTYSFGAVGAALAYSLRLIVDALLFFFAARRLGFSLSPVPSNRLSYAAAVAGLCVPFLLSFTEAISSSTALISVTIISLLVYGWLTWNKVLANEERAWVISLMPYPKRRPITSSV
jgi:O-antigen/teichoic acid export membrane protein